MPCPDLSQTLTSGALTKRVSLFHNQGVQECACECVCVCICIYFLLWKNIPRMTKRYM